MLARLRVVVALGLVVVGPVVQSSAASAVCAPSVTSLGPGVVYRIGPDGTLAGAAGSTFDPIHAATWAEGSTTPTLVPMPAGTQQSYAFDVNASGVVVGKLFDATGTSRGFRYHPSSGALETTSLLEARAVNGAGLAVGFRYVDGQPVAYVWKVDGSLRKLDTPQGHLGAVPQDINDLGVVVGSSTFGTPSSGPIPTRSDAVRWAPGHAVEVLPAPGSITTALAINEAGTIVGSSGDPKPFGALDTFGVLWRAGHEKGRRLPVPTGLATASAGGIDAAGDIVGSGTAVGHESQGVYWNAPPTAKALPQGHALPRVTDGGGHEVPSVATSVAGAEAAGYALGGDPSSALRYQCADQPPV